MIRTTAAHRCRVCSGFEAMTRGQGERCAGFVSDDGRYAHCTRPEFAEGLTPNDASPPTYAHFLDGPCRCGKEHHGGAVAAYTASAIPAAPIRPLGMIQTGRRILATYPYRSPSGAVLYDAVRFEPKGFMPRHPGDSGEMVPGLDGVSERVPYHLPELLAEPTRAVLWTEGEKDADRLARAELLATTTIGGAKSFRKKAAEYAAHFRDRGVVAILPDNDDDGRAYAADVASALHAVGVAVRVVELPGLPPKGDVSDWLDAGHTAAELRALVKSAPTWSPEPTAEISSAEPPAVPPATRRERRPRITIASSVQPEDVNWIWYGYLPLGKATMLTGDAGLGKSTITCDLAARVTRGWPMPDGTPGIQPAGVVMIGTEDGRADTVRPRLDAAGADCGRIAFVTVESQEGIEEALTLPDDLPMVAEAVQNVGAELIVTDPLVAFLGLRTNAYSDHEVRRAIGPLSLLAERMGVAALGLSHPSRSRGAGNPLHFSGGSLGFVNASRSALMVSRDPDDETRTVLASAKCNLVPEAKRPSLAYRIIGADNGMGRVDWLGGSHHTAEALLAQSADGEERGQVAEACRVMREMLAAGPVSAKEAHNRVQQEAGVSARTVDTAKARLGVQSRKDGFAGWMWVLPVRTSQGGPEHRKVDELAIFADGLRSSREPLGSSEELL